MLIIKIFKIRRFYPSRILEETDPFILVDKHRPEITGFNMYAENTQQQLTFLALLHWFFSSTLRIYFQIFDLFLAHHVYFQIFGLFLAHCVYTFKYLIYL